MVPNDTTERMLALIEPALSAIEEGGCKRDLQELDAFLHGLLTDLLRLVERDPGLEAAVADLYRSAAAIVRDNGVDALPSARKHRLFREARARFMDRISSARPSATAARIAWRHQELLCA
jgi:hypothetical protein